MAGIKPIAELKRVAAQTARIVFACARRKDGAPYWADIRELPRTADQKTAARGSFDSAERFASEPLGFAQEDRSKFVQDDRSKSDRDDKSKFDQEDRLTL
jgi:hypothetical protein